jgi:hypothetical protein
MPIRTHGDHLIFYDSHDEIDGIDLGAPTVNDAQFPEGLGYYENPRLSEYPDAETLRKSASPIHIATPTSDVRGHPALLIRMVARSGPSLRDRRIPAEFLTRFDPLVEGWVSIHSSAPSGETRRLAEALNV